MKKKYICKNSCVKYVQIELPFKFLEYGGGTSWLKDSTIWYYEENERLKKKQVKSNSHNEMNSVIL